MNIRRVESGDSTFGLSQTDVAYAAFDGEGPFAATGPDLKLRTLIALYPEAFTVVARADTGMRHRLQTGAVHALLQGGVSGSVP
jgi:TRAP-type uncharacterized transport system substrate-binding protein